MKNDFKELRFLEDVQGNFYDVEKNGFIDLMDQTSIKTIQIPNEYLNKSWDELYRENHLQSIKNDFPDLYEKLKNEKFNNKY